ncbi:MAG: hypothetical protein RL291_638, partial [Pseudomonadota bacterium]
PIAGMKYPSAPPSRARTTISSEATRTGAGTRVRARLGMPTDVPRFTPPPPQSAPRSIPAHRDDDVIAHLKLVLDATTALTELQRQLLARLSDDTENN